MAEIKKKILKEYFDQIKSGQKTYELRLADWECRPGDTLIMQEFDPEQEQLTGRELVKTVGYVGKTKGTDFWTQEEIDKHGFQIISLLD